MVTYIDISVMLDREIVSACLSKSARSRRYAAPSCQCRIEHADEIFSYVVFYPNVENLAQEMLSTDHVAIPSPSDSGAVMAGRAE